MPEITISIGSDKAFIAKLRAISRHASELADELEQIDAEKCPVCGDMMEVVSLHAEGLEQQRITTCQECGYTNDSTVYKP